MNVVKTAKRHSLTVGFPINPARLPDQTEVVWANQYGRLIRKEWTTLVVLELIEYNDGFGWLVAYRQLTDDVPVN